MSNSDFKPALIVVDMQNDFCPPNGSLAVGGALDIVPSINQLLNLPAFAVKVGTQDYHPQNHISFASNHPEPNNKPFESFVEVGNHVGGKPNESMQQRLWPDHCVQGTEGAAIIDGIDPNHFDLIIQKGMDERVEMYSAFTDSFGNMTAGSGGVSHDLTHYLSDRGVTHVYTVGLAGDYCVKDTAIGAAKAGFTSYLIEDVQRCVDPTTWSQLKKNLVDDSVRIVSMASEEVKRLF